RIRGEGAARDRLALGIEIQELLRHVADRLLDPRLDAIPSGAAELVESPLCALRAAELLNEIEPVDRHVELRVLGVLQEHEVARRTGRPREPHVLPDTVVDVDDEVADAKVPEVRDEGRALAPLGLARRTDLLAKD